MRSFIISQWLGTDTERCSRCVLSMLGHLFTFFSMHYYNSTIFYTILLEFMLSKSLLLHAIITGQAYNLLFLFAIFFWLSASLLLSPNRTLWWYFSRSTAKTGRHTSQQVVQGRNVGQRFTDRTTSFSIRVKLNQLAVVCKLINPLSLLIKH